MLKRTLLRLLVAVVILAAAAALYVFASSRTPLPAHAAVAEPDGVDLAAYRRGETQFPGEHWQAVDPDRLGWSAAGLEDARRFAEGLDTGAVMVVHRGVLVAAWGDTETRYLSQSMRKSFLSALIGRLVAAGQLDLDATLAELDVDDHPPLTAEERRATVRDLLLARSGVYHSGLYETPGWKRRKPQRGTHAPGEAWFYNNWGFNAVGTIFTRASGLGIGEAFARWVAAPVGMEDYRPVDVHLLTRDDTSEKAMGNASDHAAYVFDISTRDLARFGLLYAADGRWGERQVLPAGWVEESTLGAALPTGWDDLQYGYMWWVRPPHGPFDEPVLIARGGRGHQMVVAPGLDLVLVHRVPSRGSGLGSQLYRRFVWAPSVDDGALDELWRRIVAACPRDGRRVSRSDRRPSRPGDRDRPPASVRSPA